MWEVEPDPPNASVTTPRAPSPAKESNAKGIVIALAISVPLAIAILMFALMRPTTPPVQVTVNLQDTRRVEPEDVIVADGTRTVFTLRNQYVLGSTRVHLNGMFQCQGVDYIELGGNLIKFTTPPHAGDILVVDYTAR